MILVIHEYKNLKNIERKERFNDHFHSSSSSLTYLSAYKKLKLIFYSKKDISPNSVSKTGTLKPIIRNLIAIGPIVQVSKMCHDNIPKNTEGWNS